MLGHRVGSEPRRGYEPGQRRCVDDVSAALLHHQRIGGDNTIDHSAEVDVDHPIPVRHRELLGRAAHSDASVVDHDVEPPELGVY